MYRNVGIFFFLGLCLAGCHETAEVPDAPASPLVAQFKDLNTRLLKHFRNNDSAGFYGREMLALARQLNQPTYMVQAYNAKASAFEQLEAYDSAIHNYEIARGHFTAGVDTAHLSITLNGLGTCFFYTELYDLALTYFQEAMTISLSGDDLNAQSSAYNNSGMVLMMSEIYDEAVEYFHKAMRLSYQLGQNGGNIPPLHNISYCYLKQEMYDSAIYYGHRVWKESEEVDMPYGLGMSAQVLAEAYVAVGQPAKAAEIARKGEKIFRGLKADRELSGVLRQLASSQLALGNSAEALKIINGIIGKSVAKVDRASSYKLKSEILEQMGKYDEALETHKVYAELNEALNSEKKQQEITQQQRLFDTELKNQQIANLETQAALSDARLGQQQLRIAALSVLVLLVAIGSYLFIKQQRARSKNRMMELENRLLRTQLNPHFLFNAMGAIQQYLYSQEDPLLISDYLGKFSKLTRMILAYSKRELISLEEELEFLSYYVELQKIRFEVPFEFKLDIAGEIEPDELMIPPMLTQPFIENAIEHGFLHKDEKGHIEMSISESDRQIHITVTDDGIGRKQAAALQKQTKYESMATQITRDRLKLIQSRLKRKTELLVKDLFDNNEQVAGTRVQLNIPLIRS